MVKYCVLASSGNDNADADSNSIIFTIKDTELYVPVVTLSAKDNQKLSKHLSKGLERSVYFDDYKIKSENKIWQMNKYIFSNQNFLVLTDRFVLIYSSQDGNAKRIKFRRNFYPKGIIRSYSVINNGKKFYEQPIDSDIKRFEEIKKLTTGEGEDYTTG